MVFFLSMCLHERPDAILCNILTCKTGKDVLEPVFAPGPDGENGRNKVVHHENHHHN